MCQSAWRNIRGYLPQTSLQCFNRQDSLARHQRLLHRTKHQDVQEVNCSLQKNKKCTRAMFSWQHNHCPCDISSWCSKRPKNAKPVLCEELGSQEYPNDTSADQKIEESPDLTNRAAFLQLFFDHSSTQAFGLDEVSTLSSSDEYQAWQRSSDKMLCETQSPLLTDDGEHSYYFLPTWAKETDEHL